MIESIGDCGVLAKLHCSKVRLDRALALSCLSGEIHLQFAAGLYAEHSQKPAQTGRKRTQSDKFRSKVGVYPPNLLKYARTTVETH